MHQRKGGRYVRDEIVIFETEDQGISLPVVVENKTVWLSQAQMIELFGRDQSVISRHIKNVFKENEVEEKSNMHFLHIANSDRPVAYYSLDVIISVGYRVKSKRGRRVPKMGKFRFKEVYFTRVCGVQSAGKRNDDQRRYELPEVRQKGGTK